MSAACAKINKGGVREMNAKNCTPKYRTGWCMGKIPADWHCSKVPMKQECEPIATQTKVVTGCLKGHLKWWARGKYLLVLSTGHHMLTEQYLQVWTPPWDRDIEHTWTYWGGTSSRTAVGRTKRARDRSYHRWKWSWGLIWDLAFITD